MVIHSTRPFPSWNEFEDELDYPWLVHHVRGFEVNGMQWVLLDQAEGYAGGVFENTFLLSATGGEVGSPQPVCCIEIDGISWMAYHDLPSTVAYATFRFQGAEGWERPTDGVAIVPGLAPPPQSSFEPVSAVLLDISGEATTPELVELRPHIPVDTPPPPGPGSPEAGSLAEVFQSAATTCLSDAHFDRYAMDSASDAVWAHCVDVGVAEWNSAIASTTHSSTPR